MIKYSLTVNEATDIYVSIIFTLEIFGYKIKNSKILFPRTVKEPNNSGEIDLIEFVGTKVNVFNNVDKIT